MADARKLRRLWEASQRDDTEKRFWDDFKEGLDKKHLRPSDFSIRDLFEQFVPDGSEVIRSWGKAGHSGPDRGGVHLTEAEAVTTAAFSNITGQLVFSEVMSVWENPELLAPRLARNQPTSFLDGEKIPGISVAGDAATAIGEGTQYPQAGVTEDYVETPRTVKNGVIVPITKEMVIADRTGVLLDRARTISEGLAINKEKRVIDAAVGQTNLYRRKGGDSDGAAIASYGADSGDHDWENLATSNGLTDWTNVETALLQFDALIDPNTNEPIVVNPTGVIVPTALKMTAARVFNATGIQFGSPGSTSDVTITQAGNPLAPNTYQILSNAYVKLRTNSATTWFIGDFMKMLRYMEVWPITSVEAPPNSEMEFTNDIVNRFKVSERGAVAVIEPRAAVKSTA